MTRTLVGLLLLSLAAILDGGGDAEAANWRRLNGRTAPDLVFSETTNGLAPGTRLASFRGKKVVLLVFWLRDCPHCARELPKVQSAHERSGQSGLQVITVVHRFALNQVTPMMQKYGWTFPVVRDPTGALAQRYGGGRRPGNYVIGLDGRIKAGPSLNMGALDRELGRWRLRELGAWPTELSAARNLVYSRDYGAALRSAESIAGAAGASTEVKAAAARLAQIAGRKLENRVQRAERMLRARNVKQAREEYLGSLTTGSKGILKDFAGTSLEQRAQAHYRAFQGRAGG